MPESDRDPPMPWRELLRVSMLLKSWLLRIWRFAAWRLGSLSVLAIVGVICAILWRMEVEWHGWAGLIWITYDHRAIDVGLVLFLVWMWISPAMARGPRRPIVLLASAAVLGRIVLWAVEWLFVVFFSLTSDALWRFDWPVTWLWFLPALAAAMIVVPVVPFFLGRCLGAPLAWTTLPLSVALWLEAVPLGARVLEYIEPGHADAIHAVKTGAAIPFAVLAMGLPWAVSRARPSP